MYLGKRTERNSYQGKSKYGNEFTKWRQKTIYQFKCDDCDVEFERDKGSFDRKRCNNRFAHLCNDCSTYENIAKYSSIKQRQESDKLIGTRRETKTYPEIYVGANYKYSHNKGYIREHIFIIENLLGRKLDKGEVVHHVDGNKKNN